MNKETKIINQVPFLTILYAEINKFYSIILLKSILFYYFILGIYINKCSIFVTIELSFPDEFGFKVRKVKNNSLSGNILFSSDIFSWNTFFSRFL